MNHMHNLTVPVWKLLLLLDMEMSSVCLLPGSAFEGAEEEEDAVCARACRAMTVASLLGSCVWECDCVRVCVC